MLQIVDQKEVFRTSDDGKFYFLPVPPGIDFSGEHADHHARFASWVLLRTSERRGSRNDGESIPFSKSHLDHKFTNSAVRTSVRRFSRESEIFEWDDSYSTGYLNNYGEYFSPYCKQVRLAERYRDGTYEVYPVSVAKLPRRKKRPPVDWITRMLYSRIAYFELPEELQYKSRWHRLICDRIRAGEWQEPVRCEFGHRFHSNWTTVPGDIRSQMIADEPLARIDVKACQPLLLGSYLRELFGDSEQLREWISLCERGELNPRLRAETGIEDFKKKFVMLLFQPIYQMPFNPLFLWMQKNFPNVLRMLAEAKKPDHKNLARELQRRESRMMIDGAAFDLIKKYPNAAITTVHDEIILPLRLAETGIELIRKHAKQYGVRPSVKFSENSCPGILATG